MADAPLAGPSPDRPPLDLPRFAAVALAFCLGLRAMAPDEASGTGLATLLAALPVVALLALGALAAARGEVVAPSRWPGFAWAFVGLVVWRACGAGLAPAAYDAWVATLRAASDAAVVGLALLASTAPQHRRALVAVITAAATLVAAYALLEWLHVQPATAAAFTREGLIERVPPAERSALLGRLHAHRSTGTFAVANTLGGLLALVLPLGLALAGSNERATCRLGWILVTVLGAGLLASGSKGGILAAGLGLGLVAWSRWLTRSRARWWLLVAALAALGAAATLSSALHDSARTRWGYWHVTAAVSLDAPWLGVGPGQLQNAFMARKPPDVEETRHAHSTYLEAAAEGGVIGLALVLLAWVWPLVVMPRPVAPPSSSTDVSVAGAELWGLALGLTLGVAVGGALPLAPGDPPLVAWLVRGALIAGAVLLARLLSRVGVDVIALRAGGIALVAHAAIDFDLEVAGLAALGAAWIALAWPPLGAPALRLGTVARAVLLVAAFGGLYAVGAPARRDFLADLGRGAFLEEPAASPEELEARLDRTLAAIAQMPGDPGLRVRESELRLERRGHFPAEQAAERMDEEMRALAALDEAMGLDPENAALAARSAEVLEALAVQRADGELAARALAARVRAVESYPANPRYRLALGRALLRAGRREDAAAHFAAARDHAARLHPLNRERLGLSADEIEEIDQALAGTGASRPR